MMIVQKEENMTKEQVKITFTNIKLVVTPIFKLYVLFTSYDVLNIQDIIGKQFFSIERALSIVVNDYFGLRITNIPHCYSKTKIIIYYDR